MNSLDMADPNSLAISSTFSSSTDSRKAHNPRGLRLMVANRSLNRSHSAYLVMIEDIRALTLILLSLASRWSKSSNSCVIRIVRRKVFLPATKLILTDHILS